eukprot:3760496-Rhodomonas_salina.1
MVHPEGDAWGKHVDPVSATGRNRTQKTTIPAQFAVGMWFRVSDFGCAHPASARALACSALTPRMVGPGPDSSRVFRLHPRSC